MIVSGSPTLPEGGETVSLGSTKTVAVATAPLLWPVAVTTWLPPGPSGMVKEPAERPEPLAAVVIVASVAPPASQVRTTCSLAPNPLTVPLLDWPTARDGKSRVRVGSTVKARRTVTPERDDEDVVRAEPGRWGR